MYWSALDFLLRECDNCDPKLTIYVYRHLSYRSMHLYTPQPPHPAQVIFLSGFAAACINNVLLLAIHPIKIVGCTAKNTINLVITNQLFMSDVVTFETFVVTFNNLTSQQDFTAYNCTIRIQSTMPLQLCHCCIYDIYNMDTIC